MNPINKVLENWRKQGITMLPPRQDAEIISAFTKMNQKLSADVIDLYRTTGGMDDGEMDSNCFTLWSFEKFIEENNAFRHLQLAFGDFLIESHLYYFEYENENNSSVFADWKTKQPEKIADSLNEFFEIYLHNSEQLGLF
jgi:hypothetical protein